MCIEYTCPCLYIVSVLFDYSDLAWEYFQRILTVELEFCDHHIALIPFHLPQDLLIFLEKEAENVLCNKFRPLNSGFKFRGVLEIIPIFCH